MAGRRGRSLCPDWYLRNANHLEIEDISPRSQRAPTRGWMMASGEMRQEHSLPKAGLELLEVVMRLADHPIDRVGHKSTSQECSEADELATLKGLHLRKRQKGQGKVGRLLIVPEWEEGDDQQLWLAARCGFIRLECISSRGLSRH